MGPLQNLDKQVKIRNGHAVEEDVNLVGSVETFGDLTHTKMVTVVTSLPVEWEEALGHHGDVMQDNEMCYLLQGLDPVPSGFQMEVLRSNNQRSIEVVLGRRGLTLEVQRYALERFREDAGLTGHELRDKYTLTGEAKAPYGSNAAYYLARNLSADPQVLRDLSLVAWDNFENHLVVITYLGQNRATLVDVDAHARLVMVKDSDLFKRLIWGHDGEAIRALYPTWKRSLRDLLAAADLVTQG